MLLQKSWSNKKCPKSNINPALDAQKSLKKLFWACFGQKTSFLGVFAKMPNWNQHFWIAKLGYNFFLTHSGVDTDEDVDESWCWTTSGSV